MTPNLQLCGHCTRLLYENVFQGNVEDLAPCCWHLIYIARYNTSPVMTIRRDATQFQCKASPIAIWAYTTTYFSSLREESTSLFFFEPQSSALSNNAPLSRYCFKLQTSPCISNYNCQQSVQHHSSPTVRYRY